MTVCHDTLEGMPWSPSHPCCEQPAAVAHFDKWIVTTVERVWAVKWILLKCTNKCLTVKAEDMVPYCLYSLSSLPSYKRTAKTSHSTCTASKRANYHVECIVCSTHTVYSLQPINDTILRNDGLPFLQIPGNLHSWWASQSSFLRPFPSAATLHKCYLILHGSILL